MTRENPPAKPTKERLFIPLLLHLHRRFGAISVVFGFVIRVIKAALQDEQAAGKAKQASDVHVILQIQVTGVVTVSRAVLLRLFHDPQM